ncbi:helix-turn-helix transcriptional regulator [Anaerosporobacter sp.]
MELNKQIKKNRTIMNLSQEELAEKIYVTRQTISNWENGKSYPDIHSILLMSSLFGVSLDQLIKGDLDIMKEEIKKEEIKEEEIKEEDIKKFYRYGKIYTVLLIVLMISVAPLVYYFELYGAIIALILFSITFTLAIKVEKLKKENDIQTYKEIVAFYNGEHLDEISKNREYGKRPYQQFLLALASGLITFIIAILLFKLLSLIN